MAVSRYLTCAASIGEADAVAKKTCAAALHASGLNAFGRMESKPFGFSTTSHESGRSLAFFNFWMISSGKSLTSCSARGRS